MLIRPRLKFLLAGALVLVILPVVLFLMATALIPRDKMAAEIAELVADVTGADVVVGEASFKLVGGLGLTLNEGRVVGTGAALTRRTGAETNIESYDLAYSKLDITLALSSLLQRKVVVRSVRLVGPELLIVQGDSLWLREFDLQIDDLQLNPATLVAAVGAAPGQRIPADVSFGLALAVSEVEQPGCRWREVRLAGDWAARKFHCTALTGQLGDGHLSAEGVLDYTGDPWGRLTWQAKLVDLPAGPLLSPYVPGLGAKLACALGGDITGSLELRNEETRLRSLAMVGQVASGEGVLRAEDWLRDVSRYLGRRQDLTTVRFSRLEHEFRVADGRYLVETLEIDGHDTDWQAIGWLGFVGDLKLDVGVRLPAGFTPDLGAMSFLAERLRDDEGRVNLGLKLSGQTAAPDIGVDFGALGGR